MKKAAFFSEIGAEILGVLIVILVLKPLWTILERLIELLTIPKLRRIEQGVDRALEAVVDAENDTDRRTEAGELFEGLGVRHYAFYARARNGTFEISISRMPGEPGNNPLPAAFPLSKHLREFLGRKRTFVDLYNVPMEWACFFQQFELYGIREGTRCRYLLPICLGKSVRGLLLLPGGRDEEAICKDPIASNLGALGMAAIRP